MCISFCHRKRILYLNHSDCSPIWCEFAGHSDYGLCETCHHRDGQMCTLTHRPLPAERSCCHHNVAACREPIALTDERIAVLRLFDQPVRELLDEYGVPYRVDDQTITVHPDDFVLPRTYGKGTDHGAAPPSADDEADSSPAPAADIQWDWNW